MSPLGGSGSHWDGCWRSHLDCAVAKVAELEAEVESLQRCANCSAWHFDMFDHETHRCTAWPVDGEWLMVTDKDSCHHEPSLWMHAFDAARAPHPSRSEALISNNGETASETIARLDELASRSEDGGA